MTWALWIYLRFTSVYMEEWSTTVFSLKHKFQKLCDSSMQIQSSDYGCASGLRTGLLGLLHRILNKEEKTSPCHKGLNWRKWHTTNLGRAHIYIRVFVVSRELMLISHQNRTEQLQETLRQKMRNEDNWREKVTLDV